MAALDPAIYGNVCGAFVDARIKSGHDGEREVRTWPAPASEAVYGSARHTARFTAA